MLAPAWTTGKDKGWKSNCEKWPSSGTWQSRLRFPPGNPKGLPEMLYSGDVGLRESELTQHTNGAPPPYLPQSILSPTSSAYFIFVNVMHFFHLKYFTPLHENITFYNWPFFQKQEAQHAKHSKCQTVSHTPKKYYLFFMDTYVWVCVCVHIQSILQRIGRICNVIKIIFHFLEEGSWSRWQVMAKEDLRFIWVIIVLKEDFICYCII